AELVLQARADRQRRVEPGPRRFECGAVRAEALDLHRPRIAGEVVHDVREDLYELDAHPRQRGAGLLAHLVDHLEARAVAAALGLEPDDVVSPVLQRGEQTELGAGPSAGPVHLRDARQDAIDDAELAIGFRERRAPG